MKFFNAYDASRDLKILILKKQLALKKKENQKLKTQEALGFAEKNEIENLFLDCIDTCKRELVREQISMPHLPTHPNIDIKEQNYQPGVKFSMNGTIQAVNLNSHGKSLKQRLLQDK